MKKKLYIQIEDRDTDSSTWKKLFEIRVDIDDETIKELIADIVYLTVARDLEKKEIAEVKEETK